MEQTIPCLVVAGYAGVDGGSLRDVDVLKLDRENVAGVVKVLVVADPIVKYA